MNEENFSEPTNKIKRIDAKYISHEIQHLFHLEKGYFFTIIQLLLRPGKTIREYLNINREKYVKPVVYLIFSGVLLTLYLHYFHIEFNFINLKNFGPAMMWEKNLKMEKINEWTDGHIGYTALIVGFFVSLWTKIFFQKNDYNIYEIFVLISYCFGTLFIFVLTFTIISKILETNLIANIGAIAGQIYIVWSIGQFFGEKKILNYFKAFLCFFFGVVSYKFALTLLAYLLH